MHQSNYSYCRLSLPVLAVAGVMLAGIACQTYDPSGGGTYRSAVGSPYRNQAPATVNPQTATARAQTQLEQLLETTRRLQAQIDALEQTQIQQSSQGEARLNQARQELNAAVAENDALRRELDSLRAEQDRIRKSVDDLPSRVSKAVEAAMPPAPARPARQPTGRAAVGYEHVVEANQTLSAIAQAYKVPLNVIVRENNIKNPAEIYVGQKIFIPKQ